MGNKEALLWGLCAAYWLDEGGKGKVADCSELLAEALSILQQYRAAPQLQADIKAAHEVSCTLEPNHQHPLCACTAGPSDHEQAASLHMHCRLYKILE